MNATTAVELVRRDATIARRTWDDEALALIVGQVMSVNPTLAPPTPVEVDLFATRCAALGLDPFQQQIHAIFRRNKNGGRDMTIQVGIDGFRLIAARTGETDGQDAPEWKDRDGAWVDAWDQDYPPIAARVTVYRTGRARGWTVVANYREYAQRYDGVPQGLWARMPANQLAKCAEAAALRKAFPNDLGSLYIEGEIAPEAIPAEVAATRAATRTAAAEARQADERISDDQIAEIGRRTKAAGLTHAELAGILERVAHVAKRAHIARRDYPAVVEAIDDAARIVDAEIVPPDNDAALEGAEVEAPPEPTATGGASTEPAEYVPPWRKYAPPADDPPTDLLGDTGYGSAGAP